MKRITLFVLLALLFVALPTMAQDAELTPAPVVELPPVVASPAEPIEVERTTIITAEVYGLIMTALALGVLIVAFGLQVVRTRDLEKSFMGLVINLKAAEPLSSDLEKRYLAAPEMTRKIIDTLIAAGTVGAGLTSMKADDEFVAWLKTITDGMPNVRVITPVPPTEEVSASG